MGWTYIKVNIPVRFVSTPRNCASICQGNKTIWVFVRVGVCARNKRRSRSSFFFKVFLLLSSLFFLSRNSETLVINSFLLILSLLSLSLSRGGWRRPGGFWENDFLKFPKSEYEILSLKIKFTTKKEKNRKENKEQSLESVLVRACERALV